jgi:nucleotide-binding universal stress UspA family protein
MKDFSSKTIVVPWDFSDSAKEALRQAVYLANSHDQIEVVHVTPYPSAAEPGIIWGAQTQETIGVNLETSFRNEVDEAYKDVKFTTLFGDPGSQVAELAKEREAGLIVISSHGRTGMTRLLLGSVAERVVRLASCPVLVLRA